jgi:uncharacterized protein GlcG (DUF336 family)
MAGITLEQATAVVDGALTHGRELGCAPLTVTVLAPGGHTVALKREDGSGILRPQIAHAKAWGALGMGFGARELERRLAHLPAFVDALAAVSGGRVVPVAGGVLVRDADGELLGAIGISGDTSERDEACAVHGIAGAGLAADTGA